MGRYTVISDVGEKLVDILAEGLMPDFISDKNSISLCSPGERGDASVGIFLYEIEENMDLQRSGMVNMGYQEQVFPPMILRLHYMITAYANSDIKFRAVQEQRLLGRIMQILSDHPTISGDLLGNDTFGMDVRIEWVSLPTEEKMKIWNDPAKPYKTSICYAVTPVELESTRKKSIQRVTELVVEFGDVTEE